MSSDILCLIFGMYLQFITECSAPDKKEQKEKFNPIAISLVKTQWSSDRSECYRVRDNFPYYSFKIYVVTHH